MFNIKPETLNNAKLFTAGLAVGTAGLKVLTSKDARKVYANVIAAGIRAKDSVLKTTEKIQASTGSILAEAQEINENRAKEENLLNEEESK